MRARPLPPELARAAHRRLHEALACGVGFILDRGNLLIMEPMPEIDRIGAAWRKAQTWRPGEQEAFRLYVMQELREAGGWLPPMPMIDEQGHLGGIAAYL